MGAHRDAAPPVQRPCPIRLRRSARLLACRYETESTSRSSPSRRGLDSGSSAARSAMIPVIQVPGHCIQTDAERLRLARITRRDVADRHLIVTAGEAGAPWEGRRRSVKLIGTD